MPQLALRALPFASALAGRRSVHTWPLRIALLTGCVISLGIAAHWGDPSTFVHEDPALSRLLRGMAVIKAAITMALVAAVLWRFGRPLSKPVAAGYLLGAWALVGATTLIWQLSWIPAAAILFHAAFLSMLFVSWRER
jgi:hypothetical protein